MHRRCIKGAAGRTNVRPACVAEQRICCRRPTYEDAAQRHYSL